MLLLLNGRSSIDAFTQAYGVPLKVVKTVTKRSVSARLVAGTALPGIMIVGWSVNLQSSFGVTCAFGERSRTDVATQVAAMARAGV